MCLRKWTYVGAADGGGILIVLCFVDEDLSNESDNCKTCYYSSQRRSCYKLAC